MTWHGILFVSVHVVASVISLGLSAVAWRNREKRGALIFAGLMAAAAAWTSSDALVLLVPGIEAKLFLRTFGYLWHNVVAVSALAFALVYTGRWRRVGSRGLTLLALEPVFVGLVVTPTNALWLHRLVWTDVSLTHVGRFAVLSRSFGPWYWVNTGYNYLLVLAAMTLFVRLAVTSSGAHRRQAIALVAGATPPFAANVLWVLGATTVDFTPVALAVTGVVYGLALFRFRLFDLLPVARNAVLESIHEGYVVLDDRDRVVDLNPAARELLAVGSAPIGTPAVDLFPHLGDVLDRHERGETIEARVAVGEEPRYLAVEATSLARDRREGRLVVVRDVTERNRAERRLQSLVGNLSDVITVLDTDARITYQSPSVERVLGYDTEERLGERAFDSVHPDDRERASREFRRCVEDPSYVPNIEYRFRHADGSWVWIEARARNLLDDPAVEGVVVVARDVTERKHKEEALRRQNQRLEEFASVVSHDLRNPLNVLSGRLGLARETGDPEHLDAMASAVDRMDRLVEDLLGLARAGEDVGATTAVSLSTLAREAWVTIDAGDASLEAADVVVEADETRLRQLFENLFSNAVEHAGADVTVRVGRTPDGFYVEDDGPGIPPPEHEVVFTRGVSGSPDGTGFGLAIVEEIVEAHGWSVALVESADGGARFEFSGVELPDEDGTSAP